MPDVAAPAAPALSSLRRVEFVQTGDWIISSGKWKAARDDLVAAVAALDCPAIRRPIIKLGHSKGETPLWEGNPTGAPAIGWVDNLSLSNQGHTLVGDFVGMPGWLATPNTDGQTVIASAWPDRSVEGSYEHRCQLGHTHPFVLKAVALLGVTPPGVGTLKSLADVGRLYGVQADSGSGTTVEARFNPDQPRWPEDAPGGLGGRWRGDGPPTADSTAGSIVSTVHQTAGGDLGVRADGDGVHLGFGASRSGGLDRQAAWKLSDLLERGPVEGEEDFDSASGGVNSVATYDSGGQATGFAQVTQVGDTFELELLNNSDTLRLTNSEARTIAGTLYRYGAARRVDTDSGPVDVFLDGKNIGLRVPADDGGRVELSFPASDWARVASAINLVDEGFDDSGEVADMDRDLTRLRVQTSLGPLLASRSGDGNAPTLTLAPVDGGWSVTWTSDGRHPFPDAVGWLESTAEDLGIHNFSAPTGGRGIKVEAATVREVPVAASTADHVEGLTLGDSGADLDLYADGTVTLGWGDHATEFDVGGAQNLVGALNQVRAGEAITADVGVLRVHRSAGGDVQLSTDSSQVLLSDDDAFDLQMQVVTWFPADGEVEARTFNPDLHPRWPKGTPGGLGGRFMPRDLVPRSGSGPSRSRRRTTPPARPRNPQRRVRTGVTTADQARTIQVLTNLDQSIGRVPGTSQGRGNVPSLSRQVRDIRTGVDTGDITPDQAQQALSQLVFRGDVANDPRLSDAMFRAVSDLREAPELRTADAPEEQIRTAYAQLTATREPGSFNRWVKLSELRPLLAGATREEVDAELDRMIERPDVHLMAELNQRTLTDEDRAAAVDVGGEPRHLLMIDEVPSAPRPPAAPEPRTPDIPSPAPTGPAALEKRVSEALEDLMRRRGRGESIPLADVREALGDLSRAEQDETLRRLSRPGPDGERLIGLLPESDQKNLTQRERDAALELGNQPKHNVAVDEAVLESRRRAAPVPFAPTLPTPAPAVGDAGLVTQLRRVSSSAEARQLLASLTVAQLRAVADEVGAAYGSSTRKPDLLDSIVRRVVGFRERANAIMRGGSGPGAELRAAAPLTQVAAAADVRTGAMVALLPSEEDARRLAVDGGEAAEQLHVTLLFLGEADAYPPEARQAIVDEVRALAEVIPPGQVDGMAISAFNPHLLDKDTAIVLELGGDGLEDVHGLVEQAVSDVAAESGLALPEQHTPWRPHVTLLYSDELMNVPKLADRAGPMRLDRIRVAFAGENVDIPLTGEGSDLDVDSLTDDDMPVAASEVEAQEPRSDAPLRRYWLAGLGAAKIRWNTPGDWTRCVRQLRKYVRDPKGLCAEYHRAATGVWPGDRRNVGRRNASAPDEEAIILPNPNPTIIHAAAQVSVDDVRTAYYRQAPQQAWIREFHTSPQRLIVANDADGTVARVDFEVGDDGEVRFGAPVPVRVEYVEQDDNADKVAASRMVYASAAESRPSIVTGPPPPPGFQPKQVEAAEVSNRPWSDFDESDYTPEQWRRATILDRGSEHGDETTKSRYGLPVREPSGVLNRNGVHAAAGGHGIGAVKGISDDLRRSTARKLVGLYRQIGDEPPESLLSLAGQSMSASADPQPETPAAEPGNPTTKEDDMPLSTEVYQRLGLAEDADETAVNAAVMALADKADQAPDPQQVAAAAAENETLTQKVALLSEQVESLSKQIADDNAAKQAEVKASVIDEALTKGRIDPADKDKWAERYDKAPDAVADVLASIADGTAVPVNVQGKVGDPWDVAASDDNLPPEPDWLDGPNIDEPALAGKE